MHHHVTKTPSNSANPSSCNCAESLQKCCFRTPEELPIDMAVPYNSQLSKQLKTLTSVAHLWDWGSAHHLETVNPIMSWFVILSNLVPVSTLKSCIYIWNTSWAGLHKNHRASFNSPFSWSVFFLHPPSSVLLFGKHINQHHLYSLGYPTCSLQNYPFCMIFSPSD